MKIAVGSTNKTKVDAVEQGIASSVLFKDAEVVSVKVVVEEFGHPIGADAVVQGAIDRAKQAQAGSDYGVGIEGGLIAIPHTKTGYFEVAICAIYDGKNICLGMSPGIEWPVRAAELILAGTHDGSQAIREIGLTKEEKLGGTIGAVGLLTGGKLDRTEYNRLAFITALAQLETADHY